MSIFTKVDGLFGEDQGSTEKVHEEQDVAAVNTDEAPVEPNKTDTPVVEANAENTGSETTGQTGELSKVAHQKDNNPKNLFGESAEDSCGCAAPKKKLRGAGKNDNSGSKSKAAKVEKPKEPEHDLERMVVITAQNERRTYPPELTLEEIRVELERDFPAYSKENTNWHFEKQVDKKRYLCIPTYKFSKAG